MPARGLGFSAGHDVVEGSCGRSLNGAWSTLLGTEVFSSGVVGAARRGTAAAPRISDVFANGNSGAGQARAPLLRACGC